MVDFKIPETFPDCHLLRVLAEKAAQRHDITFNFLGRLDEFRERVSGEVRQINVLFPEYTPHDEQYHLSRLFHVADTVLGCNLIEEMNSAELFVLAAALYGHDWGMAVNEEEKHYIVTGEGSGATVNVLPDENRRFVEFARKEQLPLDPEGHVSEITVEKWREYVRQTHAFRSGERVRRFFETIDGGVADAASRACMGHWLTFEQLQDHNLYPQDFSALRETVNLRAVALYVRLIDLLDLAEDRTPYAIWKFVAPRDSHSKMEWAKHRALHPVTCPSYQQGRIVAVQGGTDDHEVYAALEDFKDYCEEQLRGCNDLLARMNDPRHKLDLYHIEWRVAARGFKPVSIRFEFNRKRMFDILSDEIYQGDPYVFLRELLQNSIDAIRMRREVVARRGLEPGNMGVIRVTVEHGDNGDARVTWRDDGIGMDEYVIRNYLAVAGQSYYRSADFEREGLKMDPISRFGIGLLSCFMVAERVEIETFKEPYLPPPGEPLKIVIPAGERQFRIETRPAETANAGTTVTVFVEGKKLPREEGKAVSPLDVTHYLSIIAGFVEFPIVITEDDRKTVVLHAKQDAAAAQRRFGTEFQVHQIDLDYPWGEAFLPQDVGTARQVLREQRVDLAAVMGLEGYDGVISYPAPATDEVDVALRQDGVATVGNPRTEATVSLRWNQGWSNEGTDFDEDILGSQAGEKEEANAPRSARPDPTYAVYTDGVLVPSASAPNNLCSGYPRFLPIPRVVVNLPKSACSVNLPRTEFRDDGARWDSPFRAAWLHDLLRRHGERLLALAPAERWLQMGRLIAFDNVSAGSLWEVFPHHHWPVLLLQPEGAIDCAEYEHLAHRALFLCPSELRSEVYRLATCRWVKRVPYAGALSRWEGEESVVADYEFNAWQRLASLCGAASLQNCVVASGHFLSAIRFLCPPWQGDPPLAQEVLLPAEGGGQKPNLVTVMEKASHDAGLLNLPELALLNSSRLTNPRCGLGPVVAAFLPPFAQFFAYGWRILNVKHPAARDLIRVWAGVQLSRIRESLPTDRIGILEDALNSLSALADPPPAKRREWPWPGAFERIRSAARQAKLLPAGDVELPSVNPDDFVPGSLPGRGTYQARTEFRIATLKKALPFGQPCT